MNAYCMECGWGWEFCVSVQQLNHEGARLSREAAGGVRCLRPISSDTVPLGPSGVYPVARFDS